MDRNTEDNKIFKVAVRSLESSGKLLMKILLSDSTVAMKVETKNENDIETEADRLSARNIKKVISDSFPDHGIMFEESDYDKLSGSDHLWVVDSIAGTINFEARIPHFGINLALVKKGEPVFGFNYYPYADDLYYAKKGAGAFHINRRLKIKKRMSVSRIAEAKDGVLLLCSGKSLEKRLWTGRIFNKTVPFFRQVDKFSNAQEAGLLGSTKAVGYVSNSAQYWDFIAHKLIVEESGGRTSDIFGNELSRESNSVIYSNGLLHDFIVNLVKDTK
ncbi:MAG: inositol monophosphatase [Candidatus Paceibacterota bacterium]|jgi:myo-inositol-1(or 4)-monophosphatase